jgi:hypothetical protein
MQLSGTQRSRKFGALVIGAAVGLFGFSLGHSIAAPLPVASRQVDSAIVQVRDGCGPGMRYSNSRGGCVPDFVRGRPPVYEERRGPPPRIYRGDDYRRGPPPPRVYGGCPPGQRFSNGMQRCVWM